LVVAVLGVWQAGAAYLPLDPEYPAGRLEFMLADSGAVALVGHRSAAGGVAGAAAERGLGVVWLDDPGPDDPGPDGSGVGGAGAGVGGLGLAAVIYTSGTTGRPKGVLVTQGSLVAAHAAWEAAYFGAGARYRWLTLASASFDVFTGDLVRALCSGGTLVVGPVGLQLEVARWAGVLASGRVNALECAPRYADELVGHLDRGGGRLAELRLLVVTTEVWRTAAAERARAVLGPRVRVLAAYGVTEATVDSTYSALPALPALPGGEGGVDQAAPIGGPLPGTRAHVVDGWLGLAPAGAPGELWIAGPQVARGYAGRPGLTAQRFVADPFAGDGSRAYRSGDQARWRADGQLEFLGRVDDQVRVRGYRIEPGEVEAALAGCPGVRAAVVAACGQDGEQRLAAYLVPADAAAGLPPVSQLRAWLGERLPAHMIPAVYTELAALPLTPNGKVDRSALPAPDQSRLAPAAEYQAPSTEVERILADIWAHLLGVGQVGANDNFFELGGDSIISIQVVARARQLGVHVTVVQLFGHQTVAGLAAVATRRSTAAAEQGLVVGDFPLSPIQRWFFACYQPNPAHFNQSMLLNVAERVVPEVLRQALNAVVEHHDALRSRFVRAAAGWVGWVVAAESAELVWHTDAADLSSDDEQALLEARANEAQASLDLADGPLVRVVVFERGTRGQLVFMVVHHLVVDAVSWPVLLEDLSLAYGQVERGAPVELPDKTTSFPRWSQRLAELAGPAELAAEAAYWRQTEQAAATRLPRDLDGPNSIALARTVSATLGAEQTERLLHEVPSAFQTQINDVLLTALGMVLTPWARAESVAVDVEGHGREDVGPDIDVSRTVGWFTSVYPVVLHAAAGGDLGAALRRTKEYLRAVPRRGLGYGLLRYLSDWTPGPDPEVAFNYLGQTTQAVKPASSVHGRFQPTGRALGAAQSQLGERTHVLEINSQIANGRLEMVWSYGSQVTYEATALRLARRYIQVLEDLIDYCCQPDVGGYTPSDFPLAGVDQSVLDLIQRRFDSPVLTGENTIGGAS
jgi:amino acid adenylation domain-containing protein/non-ribosomal peptide synthase protein (TIGR01720 family)